MLVYFKVAQGHISIFILLVKMLLKDNIQRLLLSNAFDQRLVEIYLPRQQGRSQHAVGILPRATANLKPFSKPLSVPAPITL